MECADEVGVWVCWRVTRRSDSEVSAGTGDGMPLAAVGECWVRSGFGKGEIKRENIEPDGLWTWWFFLLEYLRHAQEYCTLIVLRISVLLYVTLGNNPFSVF